MDKFEINQFSEIRNVVADLQLCFVDGDAYSRTPSLHEWRQATRLAHRLTLLCSQLYGYASACRQYNFATAQERFRVIEGGESKLEQKETPTLGNVDERQDFVEFTEQEIQQMTLKTRKLIILQKKRCRLRVKQSGKNSFTYEIRFRRDGYNISASGKTIELAKANFIEKLKTAKPIENDSSAIPTTFKDFSTYYFEKFRKPKVTQQTYSNDLVRLNKHVFPTLANKAIAKITPSDCDSLLQALKKSGKGKTADEIYSLLSVIFKAAIAHGLIERTPLALVPHVQHERVHGKALSIEEERAFFENVKETPYEILYAIILFCGLRPNELKTIKIEGSFIIAINSKRKTKKVSYKKIPICKKLYSYLTKIDFDLQRIDFRAEKTLSMKFPYFLPGHKLYDLRTTFYSRCKELGVSETALKAFAGHSLGALGNAYTDLSDEYLLKEGKKLDEW